MSSRRRALLAGATALVVAAGVGAAVRLGTADPSAQPSSSADSVVPVDEGVRHVSPAPSPSPVLTTAPPTTGPSPTRSAAPAVPVSRSSVRVPDQEPPCPSAVPLPAPASTTPVDVGTEDVREVLVRGDRAALSLMGSKGSDMSLAQADVATGAVTRSSRDAGYLLSALDDRKAWGVTYDGDLVAIDRADPEVRRTWPARLLSVAAPHAKAPKALALAESGGRVFVLGTQDPAAWTADWLAAVDASSGRLLWSRLLPGSATSGWDYLPHAGVTAQGDDVVVALETADGTGVWRYDGSGRLGARGLLTAPTRISPLTLVLGPGAVFVNLMTPAGGVDDSWATTLVRLRLDTLAVTAQATGHLWGLWYAPSGLVSDETTCDGEVVARFRPDTLAALPALDLRREEGQLVPRADKEHDLDVVGDTLWVVTQDPGYGGNTVLSSYRLG